eukprot:TRINITY_DN7573_c0_g1_i5.p1 TRINITY_DN7573_c0_g1~~TRINITY_DN7573_c0_g1_i5.p1  ORF type:complete len:221 (+),score=32.94 TRINITY_DN7573_c0_g1_i5:228-890(+)
MYDLTTVPTQLGDLFHLTELHLHNNYLRTLPTELGKLLNLTVLDLHMNGVKTFNIPTQIGRLSNLTNLQLRMEEEEKFYHVSGSIPTIKTLQLILSQHGKKFHPWHHHQLVITQSVMENCIAQNFHHGCLGRHMKEDSGMECKSYFCSLCNFMLCQWCFYGEGKFPGHEHFLTLSFDTNDTFCTQCNSTGNVSKKPGAIFCCCNCDYYLCQRCWNFGGDI